MNKTPESLSPSTAPERWIEVRGAPRRHGARGRLLFRFDPSRDLVEIACEGALQTVDLQSYRPPPVDDRVAQR